MCIKGECNVCHVIDSTWQFDVLEVDNSLLKISIYRWRAKQDGEWWIIILGNLRNGLNVVRWVVSALYTERKKKKKSFVALYIFINRRYIKILEIISI